MEIVYIVFKYIGSFTVTPAASDLIVPFTTTFLFLLAIFLVFGAKSLEAKNWLLAFLILGVVVHITGLGFRHLEEYARANDNFPLLDQIHDLYRSSLFRYLFVIIDLFKYSCLGIFVFLHWRSSEAKKWLLAFLILSVVAYATRFGIRHLIDQTNYIPQNNWSLYMVLLNYSAVIWSFAYLCLGIFVFVHWGSSRMHLNIKNILFSLSGRIPRSAFWISLWILMCLNYKISYGAHEVLLHSLSGLEIPLFGYPKIAIWIAWSIAHFWIFLSIFVKRLHDCSKSGYWLFVMLIPFLGPLILIGYLGFVRGNDGENQYGDDSLIAQTS